VEKLKGKSGSLPTCEPWVSQSIGKSEAECYDIRTGNSALEVMPSDITTSFDKLDLSPPFLTPNGTTTLTPHARIWQRRLSWLVVDIKSGTKCPNNIGKMRRFSCPNVLSSYGTFIAYFSKVQETLEDICALGFPRYSVNIPPQPRTMKISAAFCVHCELG